LRYRGEHCWIYLEDRAGVADAAIMHIGETFDNEIYPRVSAELGVPAMPGIDADPRITILLADLHGLGGYFTQIDNEPSTIERTSNERKIIYLDVSAAPPGSSAFDGNIAHEYQHLVHYSLNPAAPAWINEGMSELIRWQVTNSTLNIPAFEAAPDTQLNDWPALGDGSALPHYGAAESFLRYLLNHYGGMEQMRRLASAPGDGVTEVNAFLAGGGYQTSFEDAVAGWLAANLINDPAGGRYSQDDKSISVDSIETLAVPASFDGTVHQFGARYYSISPVGGGVTVDFAGMQTVAAGPPKPSNGGDYWWSGRGDSIDSTLTTPPLDLSTVSHATLQFDTWYDIERDFDFGYLEASRDDGVTWNALRAGHSTVENPLGIALGPAYSGKSGSDPTAWVHESVDLTPYAGSRLLLRFEYVTDEAANRNGWAVANIRVPEIGFAAPASGDSTWPAQGFRRIQGDLPQRFILQAIETDSNGSTTVQRVDLNPNNRGTLTVSADVKKLVLIVAGATDHIRTPAAYHLTVRSG
jgi:hypothetical protein